MCCVGLYVREGNSEDFWFCAGWNYILHFIIFLCRNSGFSWDVLMLLMLHIRYIRRLLWTSLRTLPLEIIFNVFSLWWSIFFSPDYWFTDKLLVHNQLISKVLLVPMMLKDKCPIQFRWYQCYSSLDLVYTIGMAWNVSNGYLISMGKIKNLQKGDIYDYIW